MSEHHVDYRNRKGGHSVIMQGETISPMCTSDSMDSRLAPVLKTFFHQCVISYTCSQSYSDGPVLRTGSTRTLPTNFLVGN